MEKSQEKSPRKKMVGGVSRPAFQEEVGNGPRFLGCPCWVCLAGLARSRSANLSDVAVLVKSKDSGVRALHSILLCS